MLQTPRYSIIGCDRVPEIAVRHHKPENRDKLFNGLGKYTSNYSQTWARSRDFDYCLELAVLHQLGCDPEDCHIGQYVLEGAKIAVDYLTGDYIQGDEETKEEMRKDPDNEGLSWFEAYRHGLLLAFLASDQESENALLEWIEPWLPFDEGPWEVTQFDNSYHKLLAEYLKGGEFQSRELVTEFQGCKKKRPKILFACLSAILDGDAETFSKSLRQFLDNYLKTEFGEQGIASYASIEASILWEVARRAGIQATDLSQKQLALIMTRETLGFAS